MVALLQLLSSCKTAQSSCIIHNCTHAYNIHVYNSHTIFHVYLVILNRYISGCVGLVNGGRVMGGAM